MTIQFKKPLLASLICSAILLGGCAHIGEQKKMAEIPKTLDAIERVAQDLKEAQADESNSTYMHYSVNAENNDFSLDFEEQEPIIGINISAPVSYAVDFLAEQLGYSVVYDTINERSLDKHVRIKASSMRPIDLIHYLERTGNLDIYLNKTTLVVSDNITLNGSFSKLESVKNAGAFQTLQTHLETIFSESKQEPIVIKNKKDPNPKEEAVALTDDNETQEIVIATTTDNITKIVIDSSTGAFYLRAKPESIRQSKELIESLINTAVSHATVELNIYRVDNNRAKEAGISVSKIIDNLYTLSTGGTPLTTTTLNYQRNETQSNGDILQAGLSLYEENGIINTESKTTLTVFNSVPTSMSDLQTVGNWIPGDLKQNNTTINGASVVTYTEDKPEFEAQEVGKKLVFTPRIDIDNKVINMEIQYINSSIYQTEQFTWNRMVGSGNQDSAVVVKRPLKTENKIEATVVLNDHRHTILAGMKSTTGDINLQFIPGLGNVPVMQDIGANKSAMNATDSLIVVQAVFPDSPIEGVIEKLNLN